MEQFNNHSLKFLSSVGIRLFQFINAMEYNVCELYILLGIVIIIEHKLFLILIDLEQISVRLFITLSYFVMKCVLMYGLSSSGSLLGETRWCVITVSVLVSKQQSAQHWLQCFLGQIVTGLFFNNTAEIFIRIEHREKRIDLRITINFSTFILLALILC